MFMIELRTLAWIKRLALASERQATAMETLARIEQDRWEATTAPRPKGKFVVGSMDIAETNKLYRRLHDLPED